jgi:hypothetical protein
MNEPDASRNRSEKEIFFEALDKNTPEERAAFLDGACGRDPAQRARVEALLADHFRTDSFMKEPAVAGVPPTIRVSPVSETAGTVIGRYKLLQQIGEGYFVNGASGEQFALPESVGLLRSICKVEPGGGFAVLSAADPLNLIGILTPGPRVAAIVANRILLRDGNPVAGLEAGKVTCLDRKSGISQPVIEQALIVGKLPGILRPYYA